MNEDTEIALRAHAWEATVATTGAGLRGLTHDGVPVATVYHGLAQKQGSQGDVLIPFPGRIGGAHYTWNGTSYTLPQNDKDGPNAIHGFLRTAPFTLAEQSVDTLTLTYDFSGAEGYPFPLRVALTYALSAAGLRCTFSITNTGGVDAPIAAGFHPYFTVGSGLVDDDTLSLPFASVLEMENFIPNGKITAVGEAGLNFRTPRPIGSQILNHCFLDPIRDDDGYCRVTLTGNGRTVTVWMDHAFDYVVLYTGENLPDGLRRASLAIEPMTCGSDAFNRPEWGLVGLEPGATLVGTWGVTLS